jgi:hypothetical protein
MHSDFPVVLDACVLANGRLCDLYLRLAEPPRLYIPIWSSQILDEVQRTQTTKLKRPYPLSLAEHWREEVQRAFPASLVEGVGKLPVAGQEPGKRPPCVGRCHSRQGFPYRYV